MKRSSMKIPPLSQLYEQKLDFSAHRRKLQKIMSDRKANLQRQCQNRTQQSIVRRHLHHYSLKNNAKSLEIAKENSKIMRKIQTIKPAYGFRHSLDLTEKQENRSSSNVINSRSRIVQQQRENSRLRERVQSMNSSLNNKKLLDDYRRSMQIKKRISHFKTEENRVVLKAQKYLGGGGKNSVKSQQMFLRIVDAEGLPTINQEGRELMERKVKGGKGVRGVAAYYNKDDIIKNKVKVNSKLFKFAREKRLKTLLNQEMERDVTVLQASKKANSSVFFPTEPERK